LNKSICHACWKLAYVFNVEAEDGSMVDYLGKSKIKPAFKLWFEIDGEYVFGEGAYELLKKVDETKSLSAAARTVDMSYRYAWGIVKEIEECLGQPVVMAKKGGKQGGRTELTETGLSLVANYEKLKKIMTAACKLR
jgi:molybdate transport system regulatory protein